MYLINCQLYHSYTHILLFRSIILIILIMSNVNNITSSSLK